MSIITINTQSYKKIITQSDKPVLVDFWAPWCTYCRRLAPAFEQTAEEYNDSIIFGQVNIDDEPQLAEDEGQKPASALSLTRPLLKIP